MRRWHDDDDDDDDDDEEIDDYLTCSGYESTRLALTMYRLVQSLRLYAAQT